MPHYSPLSVVPARARLRTHFRRLSLSFKTSAWRGLIGSPPSIPYPCLTARCFLHPNKAPLPARPQHRRAPARSTLGKPAAAPSGRPSPANPFQGLPFTPNRPAYEWHTRPGGACALLLPSLIPQHPPPCPRLPNRHRCLASRPLGYPLPLNPLPCTHPTIRRTLSFGHPACFTPRTPDRPLVDNVFPQQRSPHPAPDAHLPLPLTPASRSPITLPLLLGSPHAMFTLPITQSARCHPSLAPALPSHSPPVNPETASMRVRDSLKPPTHPLARLTRCTGAALLP